MWGCFDEFNRITPDTLSILSTTLRQILEAMKSMKEKFVFNGNEISLGKNFGYIITMNPGFLGRSQLPENLKAQFNSIAMGVCNLELIATNMMRSEGF